MRMSALSPPAFRLSCYHIDPGLVGLFPKKMAERYGMIPISKLGSVLTLATATLPDLVALDDLRGITGCDICLVLASQAEVENAVTENYSANPFDYAETVDESDQNRIEIISQEEEEFVGTPEVDQAPIVKMVDHVIREAVRLRASDIHLEPYNDHFRIRYRVDGALRDILHESLEIYPAVVARIKILSFLDVTERRLPQDGRFKFQFGSREIDLRVSVLPTFCGEKLVLRILDKVNIRSGLPQLGFSKTPISIFKDAIRRPYGMILVTGPTGSGKSTTLYSVLNLLNTPERNLMTIEDPIEYEIEGITQTQVNPEIGLTFANGLRSLLRQSPDVILVGEIRDAETSDIAVKAALTGHLVLSTLHTNSAAGAMTRLIDMGVEPFLIASSVIVVAAQRLLRQICPYCKTPEPIPPEVLKRLEKNGVILGKVESFQGRGCAKCEKSGFLGRTGAIEVLPIDSQIREAIISRSSSEEIEKLARKKGMQSLFENALELFKEGKVTLAEVLRVTIHE